MPIYTKNGDNGYSSLIKGHYVPKDSPEFEVLGKVDELQAFLYSCLLVSSKDNLLDLIITDLQKINSVIAGLEGVSLNSMLNSRIDEMENSMDKLEEELPDIVNFTGPNKTSLSVKINLARVKAREVERRLVSLFEKDLMEEKKLILKYYNRLSDYLFMIMRAS